MCVVTGANVSASLAAEARLARKSASRSPAPLRSYNTPPHAIVTVIARSVSMMAPARLRTAPIRPARSSLPLRLDALAWWRCCVNPGALQLPHRTLRTVHPSPCRVVSWRPRTARRSPHRRTRNLVPLAVPPQWLADARRAHIIHADPPSPLSARSRASHGDVCEEIGQGHPVAAARSEVEVLGRDPGPGGERTEGVLPARIDGEADGDERQVRAVA